MDGNELFYSNLDSLQPMGWKGSKGQTTGDDQQYQGVTKLSITLETALLLSIAILGAIMLLAINLVGPVFCKRCFRRPTDPERGDIFHLSAVRSAEETEGAERGCASDSEMDNPPLIMENQHAREEEEGLETVTYMDDTNADQIQEVDT